MMSMTAYANNEKNINNYTIICEIKSLNNRFLYIDTEIPQYLNTFEIQLKKIISDKIKRGKIKIKIKIQNNNIEYLDHKLAQEYINSFKKITSDNNINPDIRISDIILAEKTLKINTNPNHKQMFNHLKPIFHDTLNKLINEKIKEGSETKNNITSIINNINSDIKLITKLIPTNKEKAINKIKKYINQNLNTINKNIDKDKIWTELTILLLNKIDINEEIERLAYHTKTFQNNIRNNNNPIAKKLDFISQEMLRETNTITAKANNTKITNLCINIKTLIEQIKEQLQNIE